jgi:hypothetical protein
MKQLLFLFLLPCLAWAQYPSNGNQKITLGEQTTADGLIFRGVAADTVRKPSIDTMAYMVLDTTTNIMWHYKKATSNAWLRLNLLPSDTASMLTNYWRAGRFSGTLPVANGGTNTSTVFTAGSVVFAGSGGTYTQDNTNLFWDNTNKRLGIGITPTEKLHVAGTIKQTGGDGFVLVNGAYTSNIFSSPSTGDMFIDYPAGEELRIRNSVATTNMVLSNNGDVKINNLANASNPVNVQVDVNGVLIRSSSIELKDNVQNLPYGLNDLLLLKPYKFNYKDKYKFGEGYDIGFIAEDVNEIVPEAVGTGVNSDIFMDSVKLIPILTKAIQEQQALIKALEQRIINLENK